MFLELIEEYEMNDDDECKRRSCATDICSRLESQQAAAVAAQTNNIGEENNVDPSSSENDNTAVDGHAGNDEGVDNDCCYKGRQFAVLICISLDDHFMVNEFELKVWIGFVEFWGNQVR